MQFSGEMDLRALAQLNGMDPADEEAALISSRAIDTDGDGRPDLYLVDVDGDGSVNSVVRGLDADGDGINDTFIQYDEEGSIQSIGRIDAATGELNVIYEDPDAFDEILDSLGLADAESPEEALFASFDNPYIQDTYGSFGEEVPDIYTEPEIADEYTITDMSEEEASAIETQDAPENAETAGTDGSAEEPPEVIPRIVGIEDRSGGDASSVWAKVDGDADGLADYDAQLLKTSTGEYYGDIDKDGYSEDVATDIDMDGRIDTVDTTGQGSSSDTVGAEGIVDPGSGYLADQASGEDDAAAVNSTGDSGTSGSDYDAGASVDTSGDDTV